MTDNYERLNYTDERDLNDYQINNDSLGNDEIKRLIAEKQSLVIADVKDQTDYKMYADRYKFVPDWVLNQLYQKAVRMPRYGLIKMFLDHDIDDHYWMTELLVGMLEAYSITDYEDEFTQVPPPDRIIIAPKPLSRTEGSKSVGDMSISFESERLGIDISQPFEQFLSTLPNGIEILDKYKQYQAHTPYIGVV